MQKTDKMETPNLADILKNVSNLDTSSDTGREQLEYIDIGQIESDPGNFYNLVQLEELASNIAVVGLQQPLRVRTSETASSFLPRTGRSGCPWMFSGSWRGGQCHVQTPDLSQTKRGVGDRGGGPVHPSTPGVWGAGKAHASGASPLRHPGRKAPI